MCELLAMCTRYPTNLTLSLQELSKHSSSGGHVDGWGVAYYSKADAWRIRDISAAYESPWTRLVADYGMTSNLVIAHIRKATQGDILLENTQPFERELGGRIHTFAHNGDLPSAQDSCLYSGLNYRPVGDTDSEYAFCYLMERLRDVWLSDHVPDFETRWQIFRDFCARFGPQGPANFLYSDSEYLFAHGNQRTQEDGARRPPGLHFLCRQCHHESEPGLESQALSVSKTVSADSDLQEVVLVASVPLTEEPWEPLAEGEILAAHRGRIVARSIS